jgi:hypothetical protein
MPLSSPLIDMQNVADGHEMLVALFGRLAQVTGELHPAPFHVVAWLSR